MAEFITEAAAVGAEINETIVGEHEDLESEVANTDNDIVAEPEFTAATKVLMIDFAAPCRVIYCPTCTMPPEYCEYGNSFPTCLPWIAANCPEVLSDKILASMMGEASMEDAGEDGKKTSKRGGVGPKKKAAAGEVKVIIAKIQRQKKKYVTVVTGLETIPDVKIKDAARVFGKKFSSGSSISDTATGGKEVVIQGDVMLELPALLMSEFKVAPTSIYFNDDGRLNCYA